MEELLTLARKLRPAVLDDHGLIPALHSQVGDFADQTGIRAQFSARGTAPRAHARAAARDLPRDPGEPVEHRSARRAPKRVDVELSFIGRTVLRINDDGRGFSATRNGGLGLSGMRERALLVGGQLTIWSDPGQRNAGGADDRDEARCASL